MERLRAEVDAAKASAAVANAACQAFFDAAAQSLRTPLHVLMLQLVVVVDKGPGIPSHSRSRIFNKFDRGNGPTGTSGLGLGLWIARQIVEAHGGTINVEDARHGGAAFVVAIPCLAANAG